eukprot:4058410-Amphidinium_carterae.1
MQSSCILGTFPSCCSLFVKGLMPRVFTWCCTYASSDSALGMVSLKQMHKVLKNAGLMQAYGVGHNEERVLAMLVLTAIHDVMKVACRSPWLDFHVAMLLFDARQSASQQCFRDFSLILWCSDKKKAPRSAEPPDWGKTEAVASPMKETEEH